MKKRVMCFGTFDIIHPGHIKFLTRARALGDELFVVVSRDERRAAIRGKTPVHTQAERVVVLSSLSAVTQALAGKKDDILAIIRKIKPSIIALGHDQVYGVDVLQSWCASQKNPPQIVRLPAYKRSRYSTSRIKEDLCPSNP
ncbi:MAG: synthetase [Patescibacteria group bacterium]|jgi:FAD synthetase|nr:synthetase [Patescibacteria group bacterium]